MLASHVALVSEHAGPDGLPARAVFLVLTPVAASGQHVKLLAEIARLMHARDSRAALLAARSPNEFLDVIRDTESVSTR